MSSTDNPDVYECRKENCSRVFLTHQGRGTHEQDCANESTREYECSRCDCETDHTRKCWLKWECIRCGTWQIVDGKWE